MITPDIREEARILRLSNVIRTSIDEMMSEKMAQQFAKKQISANAFTKRLLQVLEFGLKCEREQYIKDLLDKIKSLEKEKENLKSELASEKRRFAHENTIISTDKAYIQKKYETLDENYKVLGWRKDRKENTYQEQISIRDRIIHLQRMAINQTVKSNNYMKMEIKELRDQVTQNHRNMMKLLRATKANVYYKFQDVLNRSVKKQKKKDYIHFQTLSTEYKAEKMAHDQLKGASQLLLDSVWNISPKRRRQPKVSLEELPRKISEVNQFIQDSVDDQKEIAVENVKKDLSASLPEMSILGNTSVTDAVSTVITDRVAEKEAEFQNKMREANRREDKLRRKLQNALAQIQNLKQPKLTPPQYRYVEEFQDIKDDWDEQKSILDKRMQELSQGMNSSLRSPFRNSIFNSP